MNGEKTKIFRFSEQSKKSASYLLLFLWLSLTVHMYIFWLMSLSPHLRHLMDFEKIPRRVVQNVILETQTETPVTDENASISDKNNINSSLNFDPSKEKIYNYAPQNQASHLGQDGRDSGTPQEQAASKGKNQLEAGKSASEKRTAQSQKQAGGGTTAPLLFDVSKPPLVNLYNNGRISVATEAKEYASYFIDMQKKIEKYHREFFPIYQYYQGLLKDGVVIVEYTIGRDGSVRDARIVSSFGSDTVDNASLNSIIFARNFGPLPEALAKEEEIKIRFHFIYLAR